MDSNAPPQTRGTPVGFARGAPVVAKRQPIVRDGQLTNLRDGPAPEFLKYAGTRYWDWNAPPDKENTSAIPKRRDCVNSARSAVNPSTDGKRKRRKEDAMNAKDEVELKSPQGESIRGKPFTLRDAKSYAGGMPMIEETR